MTLTTLELKDYLKTKDKKGFHLRVPIPYLDCWDKKNLPIHPYLLGILIAEGCLGKKNNVNNFTVSLPEIDIKEKVETLLNMVGYTLVPKSKKSIKNPYDYRMTMLVHKSKGLLQQELENVGLRCNSIHKFIPKEYLLSSVEDRLELLRGLFDGDGYVSTYKTKKGYMQHTYEYTTCSKQLSNDFSFLVRSLGIVDRVVERKAHYKDKSGNIKYTSTKYRHILKVPSNLIIYSSKKHSSKAFTREFEPIRKIISVDLIGKKECQCIYVESKEHTYITNNITVTHNTTLSRLLAGELGVDFIEAYGPTLRTADDLFKVLCNGGKRITPHTVLFIDEIHSVPTEVLELLYGLMEDGVIILGSKRYKLPSITIIGGTTSAGKVPTPLYTRFIEKCVLVDYTEDELTQMGMATANKLGLKVEEQAIRKLVAVCSKTPRVLNNLVRAAQVFCIAYDIEEFKSHDVLSFLSFQGIDHEGFNANDRTYLKVLFNNIVEGQRVPIGFSSICKKGNLIKDEVENLIEPKMLLKEFISFSGKGRFLTDKGLEYCSKL